MKQNLLSRLSSALTGLLVIGWCCAGALPASAQTDPIADAKKTTADLTAADKEYAAAANALLGAKEALDASRFNSAAYNAKIAADGLAGAKAKYEQAAPEAKEDALEAFELAQELDAQRKSALEEAQKLLPQREAEAKAAGDKFSAVLASADAAAAKMKELVRQADGEVHAKTGNSKAALEKAAFAAAEAEQKAAANAAVAKAFADCKAAEAAMVAAASAAAKAPEPERPAKLAEAGKAVGAFLNALHTASRHLPAIPPDKAEAATLLQLRTALVEADKVMQRTAGAVQQAKQTVQDRAAGVKQTEDRIKAAQEGVEKRIAKISAKKELAREQEALKRAQAALAEAEPAVPPKAAEADKAAKDYDAALQAAVKALVQVPEPDKALVAGRVDLAKVMADTEAAANQELAALKKTAEEAAKAAEGAKGELAAAEKTASEKSAVRAELHKVMRQRFFRDIRAASEERQRHNNTLAAAEREMQAKTNAANTAAEAFKQAQAKLTAAQEAANAKTAVAGTAAKDREAAQKAFDEKTAAAKAAEQKVNEAQAAVQTAKTTLASVTGDQKPVVEKQVADGEKAAADAAAAAKQAADAAQASRAVLDKAVAAQNAADKTSADLAKAAADAGQKCTEAKAANDKTAAELETAKQATDAARKPVEADTLTIANAKAQAIGGLKPLDPAAWDYAKARHLLVRAGFGGTPDEVAKLHALGLHGAVASLVDFTKQPAPEIPFVATPKEPAGPDESSLAGDEQNRLRQQRVERDRQQLQNMRAWWLRRMVESPRPLEEKLTLFWHGQIPVQYSTVGDSYHMFLQNQLYREHAAGSFSALLYGVSHDAAMLKYLNNDTNIKGRANENLAREIMELFSMGRDQGYTEIDIRQGARALTGYTYDPLTGQFRYLADRHDTEPKTVLGKSGNWSGDDFVRLILETPHPARFVARQMFAFFVHSEPSLDTVESMAGVLRLNDYRIEPMLENLFLSEEFYSERAVSTTIKSPVQLLVGLHRDLGLKNPDYAWMAGALRDMGQELFEPPSVFGWQSGRSWITTSRMLSRYNVLGEVLERRPRAGQTGVDAVGTLLAGKTFASHAEVVDWLVKCVWTVPVPDAKRQALIEFLKPLPPPDQWAANPGPVNTRLTRLLVMLLCTPEAQLG